MSNRSDQYFSGWKAEEKLISAKRETGDILQHFFCSSFNETSIFMGGTTVAAISRAFTSDNSCKFKNNSQVVFRHITQRISVAPHLIYIYGLIPDWGGGNHNGREWRILLRMLNQCGSVNAVRAADTEYDTCWQTGRSIMNLAIILNQGWSETIYTKLYYSCYGRTSGA